MSNVSKGKEFEKDCIIYLNSLFDKVEWLSEEKKSVFDFKCYKDDREYLIEAKFSDKIRISKEDAVLIKISIDTKTSLELMKIHPRQSYDEVIRNKILEKANESSD